VKHDYVAEAVHCQGMQFDCNTGAHTVTFDYPLTDGDPGLGATPLQMLLGSLTACLGGAMVVLLGKARQPFTGLVVRGHATRRDEHPTVFTAITLDVVVRGAVDADVVSRCLAQAEERICPVLAMLRPGTPITTTCFVEPAT
jgi:putative redox protein